MSEHSYGHSTHCYYCGVDGDVDDDKPCAGSLVKHPTAEQKAAWLAVRALGEAIEEIGADVGMGLITFDVALQKICALKPKA